MAKKKRIRIEAIKSFSNVSQQPEAWKGKWKTSVFGNDHEIVLELGCGHGNYTIELAQRFPQKNYIGLDLKGARLWVGAKKALDAAMTNVFFIRGNAAHLTTMFEPGEISEIWLPFPDPYPKKPRKRLTSTLFLDIYRQICTPDAVLHFKTDDDALYRSTLDSLAVFGCRILYNFPDLYRSNLVDDLPYIQTTYEKRHLAAGKTIKYIRFQLPSNSDHSETTF
ncbi:MAG: tRNA (guanosine(46)-N7)-methyltransferase TrmB [candidate division KSB1 bacterium]|nr:tRNA (guanosine(46)-N7)-methyltransferase TrmB [candidate division KSB1 bacterium]